ncbi:MAG: hypothetical protein AAFQ89_10240, partial [Cyanobacteria bacterium J06626_18]
MYPFISDEVLVDRVQFASNDIWEDVQVVHPGNFKDLYLLSVWLDCAPRDIAAEALFTDDRESLTGFLGIRAKDLPNAQRTLLWMRLTMQTLREEKIPFTQLVNIFLKSLEFSPAELTLEPTFEMGVFNFWKTAEPLLLGTSPLETLTELLKSEKGPDWLFHGHEAPICLE